MPPLAYLGANILAFFGATSFAYSTAMAVGVIAATAGVAAVAYGVASLVPELPYPSLDNEAAARKNMFRSSLASRKNIYGTALVSGPIVFAETTDGFTDTTSFTSGAVGYGGVVGDLGTSPGTKNSIFHFMVVLADHPVEEIGDIYFGEDLCTDPRYDGRFKINKHLGHVDQVGDPECVTDVANWTTNHRLRGIAYLYVRLKYDPEVWTGIPQVRAVVKGKNDIYDPRGGGSTGWTDNWALCVADFLKDDIGFGAVEADIKTDATIAAANVSAEIVNPIPTVNISTSSQKSDSLTGQNVLSKTEGNSFVSGGAYKLWVPVTNMYDYYIGETVVVSGNDYSPFNTSWVVAARKKAYGLEYLVMTAGVDISGESESQSYAGGSVTANDVRINCAADHYLADGFTIGITGHSVSGYNGNCTARYIDSDTFAVQNLTFTSGGTGGSLAWAEERFTCNGVVDSAHSPAAILEQMLTAGAGACVFTQGQFVIHPGAYSAPVRELTADDLRGAAKIQTHAKRADLYNTIKGTYINPNNNWEPAEFGAITSSVYVTEDGEEIVRDIALHFTDNTYRAQMIAKIELARSRQAIVVEMPCKMTALDLAVMETVTVTIDELGWASKEFTIIDWSLTPEGVDLVLKEEASANYSWNVTDANLEDPAPNTNLPDPWTVPTPQNFDATVTQETTVNQTLVTKVTLTWDAGTEAYGRTYIVEYQMDGDSDWITLPETQSTSVVIYGLTNETWHFRVKAISVVGRSSDWVYTTEIIDENPYAPFRRIFYQPDIPTGNTGDLWYDSDDNNQLYMAMSDGSDEITDGPPAEWVLLANASLKTAVVYLYQRAASAPGDPSGDIGYTFSDGSMTNLPSNGWQATIPTTNGHPLWVIVTTVIGSGASVIINPTDWAAAVKLSEDGLDGQNGADGVDGDDGISIVWQGSFSSHPGSPQDGWAYYNTTDKKSYVYYDPAWYQMTIDGVDGANGADGDDGLSIVWKGELADPPSPSEVNWVYKDTDNNQVYICTIAGSPGTWELMVADGSDGAAGADGDDGLSVYITYNDNALDNPPNTPDNVAGTSPAGWHTTPSAACNWMSQKVDDGTTSNWGAPIAISGSDGADGQNGADGVDGADGTSIIWQGSDAGPGHPGAWEVDGYAYYNIALKKSYTYQSGTWYQMTIDGVDGANGADGDDGLSIVWKGELANPPSPAEVNWVYKDTDNNMVYICTIAGSPGTWELMVADGNDGTPGTDGDDGLSVYITYNDNAIDNPPNTPDNVAGTSPAGWHTAPTSACNWMSQKVDDGTTSNWGTPIIITGSPGADGQDGVDGLNVATLYIYQRAASEPNLPSAQATYNFSTKVISGLNNGWTQAIPTFNGDPLWMTTATASSTSSSDTIDYDEWQDPPVIVTEGMFRPPPDSDLLYYWGCNEAGGSYIYDVVAGAVGTLTNGVQFADGIVGSGLEFGEIGADYVALADDLVDVDRVDGWSISLWCWVNPDIASSNGRLLQFLNGTDKIMVNLSSNVFPTLSVIAGGTTKQTRCGTSISHGEWHHLVLTCIKTAGVVYYTFYVDSVLSAGQVGISPAFGTLSGMGVYAGSSSGAFRGKIDEVRIYGRVITASEVRGLYFNPEGLIGEDPGSGNLPSDLDLIGYWDMDEGTGEYCYDKSGYGNHARRTGATCDWVDGKAGRAISFASSNSRLNIGSGLTPLEDIGSTGYKDITVSAWVRNDGQVNNGWIIGYYVDTTRYFAMFVSDYDTIYCRVKYSSTDYGDQLQKNGTTIVLPDDGQWHHIVGVIDATNRRFWGMVDGVRTDIQAVTYPADWSSSSVSWQIGNNHSAALPFEGDIDEVRIYNRALTPSECKALYLNPSGNQSNPYGGHQLDGTYLIVGTDGTRGDYTTIADALADLGNMNAAGIFLKPGTYTISAAQTMPSQDVHIIGQNQHDCIIEGPSSTAHAFSATTAGSWTYKFQNFTFNSNATSDAGGPAGIYMGTTSCHCVLDALLFNGNTDYGALFSSSGHTGNLHIRNCELNNGSSPIAINGGTRVIIRDNIIKSAASNGMYIQNADNVLIQSNMLSNCPTGIGVVAATCDHMVITGNYLYAYLAVSLVAGISGSGILSTNITGNTLKLRTTAGAVLGLNVNANGATVINGNYLELQASTYVIGIFGGPDRASIAGNTIYARPATGTSYGIQIGGSYTTVVGNSIDMYSASYGAITGVFSNTGDYNTVSANSIIHVDTVYNLVGSNNEYDGLNAN